MTEDIRILRNALARYREFVEVPAGDPLEVPLYLYKSAKEIYAEACDPERIRRHRVPRRQIPAQPRGPQGPRAVAC